MKARTYFVSALAACMLLGCPVSAEETTTEVTSETTMNYTTETLPPQSEPATDFSDEAPILCALHYQTAPGLQYTGTALDLSGLQLKLLAAAVDGAYPDGPLGYLSFSITNEAYAGCFTLDTSEIDLSTPGRYDLWVASVPGAVVDIPWYLTSRGHDTKGVLVEKRFSIPVIVSDPQMPSFHCQGATFNLWWGEDTSELTLYHTNGEGLIYEIADESVIRLSHTIPGGQADRPYQQYCRLVLELVSTGETVITVRDADGNVLDSCTLTVICEVPESTECIETTTAMAIESAASETTTSTTAVTADAVATETETTTVLPEETTAASDLPQTGGGITTADALLSGTGILLLGWLLLRYAEKKQALHM